MILLRPAFNARRIAFHASALFIVFGTLAFAQTAAPAKLSVTATPLGAAAKEKMLPVSAVAAINLVIKNEGTEPVSKVVVIAKLDGVKLEPSGEWKADGDEIKLEIPEIKAAQELTRRLHVRVDAAPLPPGRKAEITFEVRGGDAIARAQTAISIADCATAFHAQLTRVRIDVVENVRKLAEEVRKPDASLPRTRIFRVAARKGDLATLERLAAGVMARGAGIPELGREGMRYTVARWTNELRAYTGQEPNPGLCAGNYYLVAGYRQNIIPITQLTDAPKKAAARALALVRKTLDAKDDEDLSKIALRVAETANVKIENAPATTLALLERIRDELKEKSADEQIEKLSLIETAAWLQAGAAHAAKLSNAIERTIDGMTQAQKQTCVCAY